MFYLVKRAHVHKARVAQKLRDRDNTIIFLRTYTRKLRRALAARTRACVMQI